ncbi:hypothetical protein C5B85_08245 [Pseudoclavibacter sp. AY1F1]|uniref:CPBP family intramembrane glutamic endopeptidase n=1 Tax=Pseudoclavibacter sp. AY1F1 TaxID=2080583 RepID=UPI000CE7B983|nr:type II CAAX endopeptidase family protein [Pseudoclavibacter sp. AY1F1]PPF45544.1 hypothetical protein C5B85_08245 [Pseudoclavibacter sp. AY1F1]
MSRSQPRATQQHTTQQQTTQQQTGSNPAPARRAGALLASRLALVAAATVVAWMLAGGLAGTASFPPSPMLASLSLLPVNIVSLVLVARFLKTEGTSLRGLFNFERRRLPADLAWAVLWLTVLAVPFAATILGTVWLLHGEQTFTAFETIFFAPDAATISSPGLALALGVLTVLTFAPLNAPAEEAVYRGYALSRLSAAWPPALAIAVTALTFGLQHAFFAPSSGAMLVYVAAFTVWGLGAALIVRWQKRLLPVTIAHFVVNLMTSLPAVIFPALQLTGAIPA